MMVISEMAAACVAAPRRGTTQLYGPGMMRTDVRGFKRRFDCGCCGRRLRVGELISLYEGSVQAPTPPGSSLY